MSSDPEIAAEIRGLLEECAADPASAIRLAPRRPLAVWYERDEPVTPTDAARTSLSRHLLESHREAVADLLLRAARLAYWKAPEYGHPLRDDQGQVVCFEEEEEEARAESFRRRLVGTPSDEMLVARCIEGIKAEDAHVFAQASLAIAPSDDARYFAALTLPWARSSYACVLLERLQVRLAAPSPGQLVRREHVSSLLAARLCAQERLLDALAAYRAAALHASDAVVHRFYSFHLACLASSPRDAIREAAEIESRILPQDHQLAEATGFIAKWYRTCSKGMINRAKSQAAALRGRLPPSVAPLLEAMGG